jgi:hypothetical protein
VGRWEEAERIIHRRERKVRREVEGYLGKKEDGKIGPSAVGGRRCAVGGLRQRRSRQKN